MAEYSRLPNTEADAVINPLLEQHSDGQSSHSQPHVSPVDSANLNNSVAQNESVATVTQAPENTSPASKDAKIRKRSTGVVDTVLDWVPEIVSLLISVIALMAIVLVVKLQDGKPLHNVVGTLTLNGMVQILSSILKAAMLMPVAEAIGELKWLWFATGSRRLSDMGEFDLASRGPRGSLRFIFRLPYNKLACLGAAITLISLGSDTLTQLAVQTYDCLADIPGQASLSRTNNYTEYNVNNSYNFEWNLDSQMYLAMFEGLLDPPANATANLPSQCISGNCTFPNDGVYSSIALCHSFTNITDELSPWDGIGIWAIPNSLVNVSYHSPFFSSAEINITDAMYTDSTPLFQFEAITAGSYAPDSAFRASIYPCIQSFSGAQISNSQIQQTLVATTPLARIGRSGGDLPVPYYSLAGNISAFPGVDCSPAESPQGNKTVPAHQLKDGRHYVIPLERYAYSTNYSDVGIPGGYPGPQKSLYYDPYCTWTFGIGATNAIQTVLEQMFGTQDDPQLLTGIYGSIQGEYWIQLLMNASSTNQVDSYMNGLAMSMTAAVRRNGDPTISRPLQGTIQVPKTCVQFQWEFLIYDVVLILATMFFLASTLIRSIKTERNREIDSRGSPWKSAALPLLWCGLEGITQAERPVDTEEEISEQSRTLKVQLVRVPDRMDNSSTGPALNRTSQANGQNVVDADQDTDEEKQTGKQAGKWVLEKKKKIKDPKERRIRKWGGKFSDWLPI
jgi:hypothetical protein